MLQPRNIDVRHNGKVVRRMAVRRRTIYPSLRCRREYWKLYIIKKKQKLLSNYPLIFSPIGFYIIRETFL